MSGVTTRDHGAEHGEEEQGVSEDLGQVVVDGILSRISPFLSLLLIAVPVSGTENDGFRWIQIDLFLLFKIQKRT